MIQYFDKIIRGTENEDSLVIIQYFKKMIGQSFTFLNYYKEIPVSYDAKMLSVDNDMVEFEVHEYQAKVISMEHKALIYSPKNFHVKEDIVSEAFYVNIDKKKVILCNFGYAKIWSDMRRFVRVQIDRPLYADLHFENGILKGNIKNLSLGGAAMNFMSSALLHPDLDVAIILKLPDLINNTIFEVGLKAKIIRVNGNKAPFSCLFEFYPEKHSQQQISYYINQRQVEIIKELKDFK